MLCSRVGKEMLAGGKPRTTRQLISQTYSATLPIAKFNSKTQGILALDVAFSWWDFSFPVSWDPQKKQPVGARLNSAQDAPRQ